VVVGKRRPRFAAPWLVYAGQVQSPERVYGAADVLLHPTYYDACANVVLEGLACGLPVVSSDQNGSAEVIEPGVNSLVLGVAGPRSQVEGQWREAVARLATAPDLRQDLGQAARHLAQRHSIALYVDRFEAYIEEVAHAKAGE
jgi:UDP-glucose:(heptosyl)LPS alpha-1,3-glucosyltransferase